MKLCSEPKRRELGGLATSPPSHLSVLTDARQSHDLGAFLTCRTVSDSTIQAFALLVDNRPTQHPRSNMIATETVECVLYLIELTVLQWRNLHEFSDLHIPLYFLIAAGALDVDETIGLIIRSIEISRYAGILTYLDIREYYAVVIAFT